LIKTRSVKKLNKKFEAKFFLDKKSSKGRTLIGVSELDENLFFKMIPRKRSWGYGL
jgi:hypothetical protein